MGIPNIRKLLWPKNDVSDKHDRSSRYAGSIYVWDIHIRVQNIQWLR